MRAQLVNLGWHGWKQFEGNSVAGYRQSQIGHPVSAVHRRFSPLAFAVYAAGVRVSQSEAA